MRDRETIDAELRLIASVRRSMREQGGQPSCRQADELLDERLGHRAEASEIEAVEACETGVVADTWRDLVETDDITPHRRKAAVLRRFGTPHRRNAALRRFGPLAALPLSLGAVAIVLVVMFAVHHPHPAAQPTVVPPSSARPNPAPPKAPAPPLDIVDRAFIDALKRDGVPVPSYEYVMIHGHAVCDFLTHQSNFAEAVGFVQRSSIWEANQSADFAAGAIVSYCPQYEPASPDKMQQTYQNALSDLQAIQGGLQGIQGDLQGIRDDLQAIPGHQ
jgi:Protein of unknown function (DUF732)